MHAQGPSAWTNSGWEERKAIIDMGEPWTGLNVLEIGCGEGDLAAMMSMAGAEFVTGIDYSSIAILKADQKYHSSKMAFLATDYRKLEEKRNRLVLQGVLEHLDYPFKELKWMMDNLLKDSGDVITSSPCFLNPRGFIWMALDMVGAVMSKTDLHMLHPWEFEEFCNLWQYKIEYSTCDIDWGWHEGMIEDFRKRLPLALQDGKLNTLKIKPFLRILRRYVEKGIHGVATGPGANMIYRITK